MATDKYLILLCSFSLLSFVTCELNLSEGSPCVTQGLQGTCANIFNCNSAALPYVYTNAGYDPVEYKIPHLPDICSYEDNEPVVCCTDCYVGADAYRHLAVGPYGLMLSKEGPVARQKCFDFFQSLPFSCRYPGYFQIEKFLLEKFLLENRKCHVPSFIWIPTQGVIGRSAERREFPHAALLGYGDEAESAQWLCGGSVISERFILTAAHCTSTVPLIAFGGHLLPACLDVGQENKIFAAASGWGRLGHKKALADVLQVIDLQEFNETECSTMYRPHRHLKHGYDHNSQMCYGSHWKVVDTCEGDSGGPLQVDIESCLYTIVGVTSYGKDCGILGSAGIYTRVSYYVP